MREPVSRHANAHKFGTVQGPTSYVEMLQFSTSGECIAQSVARVQELINMRALVCTLQEERLMWPGRMWLKLQGSETS